MSAALRAEAADLVALQEIDRPSSWSYGFDRLAQVGELTRGVGGGAHPLIVLGDTNCSASRGPDAVDALCRALDLHAYQAEAALDTYPAAHPRRRLDWILLSRALSFLAYRTVDAAISDHRPLLAEIRCTV